MPTAYDGCELSSIKEPKNYANLTTISQPRDLWHITAKIRSFVSGQGLRAARVNIEPLPCYKPSITVIHWNYKRPEALRPYMRPSQLSTPQEPSACNSVAAGCRTRAPHISWHAVRGTRTILGSQCYRAIGHTSLRRWPKKPIKNTVRFNPSDTHPGSSYSEKWTEASWWLFPWAVQVSSHLKIKA